MIEDTIDDTELAFLEELRKYENRWVAIVESGDQEIIVGSGEDATQAKEAAQSKGFKDTVLFRVLPFDKRYIPAMS